MLVIWKLTERGSWTFVCCCLLFCLLLCLLSLFLFMFTVYCLLFTISPLRSSITVSVIMLDDTTNQPIDALDVVRILEDQGAEEKLADAGLQASDFTAPFSSPIQGGEEPNERGNEGEGLALATRFLGNGTSE